MRKYATLSALRSGGVIVFEGCALKMAVDEHGNEQQVRAGDCYIAERNTGPTFLTARLIHEDGYVSPVELGYCYDLRECVKVEFN